MAGAAEEERSFLSLLASTLLTVSSLLDFAARSSIGTTRTVFCDATAG